MSATTDRTFADVADQFAAWESSRAAGLLERAWVRAGYRVVYLNWIARPGGLVLELPDAAPVVAALVPSWVAGADHDTREAVLRGIRDEWQREGRDTVVNALLRALLAEVAAEVASEMTGD